MLQLRKLWLFISVERVCCNLFHLKKIVLDFPSSQLPCSLEIKLMKIKNKNHAMLICLYFMKPLYLREILFYKMSPCILGKKYLLGSLCMSNFCLRNNFSKEMMTKAPFLFRFLFTVTSAMFMKMTFQKYMNFRPSIKIVSMES